ncbi:MAG: transcription-repair coupling factor [Bacteroidales bacterium]
MQIPGVLELYQSHVGVEQILHHLSNKNTGTLKIKGLHGSSKAYVVEAVRKKHSTVHLIIVDEKEEAAYLLNDLENLTGDREKPFEKRRVLFYPTSYRRPYEPEFTDNANVLSRAEVLNKISTWGRDLLVVTYPEALSEKVVTRKTLRQNTLTLHEGEAISMDFLADMLLAYGFERVDFVVEPGQFAIRGGIADVFSFSHEYPFRIEFDGDQAESIRTFDPASQLSIKRLSKIDLQPSLQGQALNETRENFLDFLPENTVIWITRPLYGAEIIEKAFENATEAYRKINSPISFRPPEELFMSQDEYFKSLKRHPVILMGGEASEGGIEISFNTGPQPHFNKNFDLLFESLAQNDAKQYFSYIFSDNPRQLERIRQIVEDLGLNHKREVPVFSEIAYSLHEGFVDHDIKIACYTDHQIFNRYHRYRLREGFAGREALTIKELSNLRPGDYVVHIDHGIGRFDGMEIIENNGRKQEVLRIIYQNNDLLYVSIHSLHRIARYTGKDGTAPALNKLGTKTWQNIKNRTKERVKDIARDLIQLYARRKASQGFAYSPDTYLQHELEASFIYEDTPDQLKATQEVKADMEKPIPMDRLICGDVGFGKTEVAIRAAFKAATDGKQVAVLVPTTILALQHFKTFTSRLQEFPVKIEYLNRFKNASEQKQVIQRVGKGEIDIIIGTHRLLSADVKFKDLGLVIIDEEQKFGVAAKEKLRQLRVNVDTLTLTATPIPRTLQFSLMGARDLSVINTPPPNRQPVHTEIRSFSAETIRDAILYELNRGGQVFFVHNRVENIMDVAGMVKKFVPDARIAIGHGQMEGKKLEKVMTDFIEGEYDILVATTIIESGLDIPNVNTIIINEAQNFGLADLHQLRGRVGRSNRKAFCYLLTPPLSTLSEDARKRLRAIEEFSNIGSGFHIAMRDLDIRGAGNLLGAEQSGFISELGYETYQKILDEALRELRETEFKGLFPEVQVSEGYVDECVLETDLDLRFPVEYIGNLTERLSLYKELDSIDDEEALQEFSLRLEDRFGPMPPSALGLIETIRLRKLARWLAIEKIVLKNNQMVCHFVSNEHSPFFKSPEFEQILRYVQAHPRRCRLKQAENRLSLTVLNIPSIDKARLLFNEWLGKK